MCADSITLHVVILAGGSGTRFWPLSRETYPKQMLKIAGEDTLIRQTIRRIAGRVPPENIWIVTTESQAEDIRFHLDPLGPDVNQIHFIKEPLGRNTAPAIGLAAIHLDRVSSESIMIVMPSDHVIPSREKFLKDLEVAVAGARKDCLITFGIKPTHPETGYGYIQVEKGARSGIRGLRRVKRFVEKPDLKTAKTYLSAGNYFWNSGIFVWKASKILSSIEEYLPSLYRVLEQMRGMLFRAGPLDPFEQHERGDELHSLYSRLENISIDYGVMERSKDVWMVPARFPWSDVGSWTALDGFLKRDRDGNIVRGNVIDVGSEDSIIFADERVVATIGLKDVVLVDTPDATLVTRKDKVQEVRKIVGELKRRGSGEHFVHRTVERPWGSYTVLEERPGYKVKRIVIKPGARLSLQLHRRRSEHWIVVSGTAKVTRGQETSLAGTGESTTIAVNTRHRVENSGTDLLEIIEVQSGDYFGEDDIERFEDDYGRKTKVTGLLGD